MRIAKLLCVILLLVAVLVPAACAQAPAPTTQAPPTTSAAPKPSPSPSPTASPTATAKPTATPTSAPAPQAFEIRLATTGVGTDSYKWALALQQMLKKYAPEITEKILPTEGGAQSLQMLKAGDSDIGVGFAYLDGKQSAWWDTVGLLFPHLPIYSLVVVKKDSPVKTWEDLKGKRICPSTKGGSGAVYWEKQLLGLGWQPDKDFTLRYAAYVDMPAMLRDGTVDVLMMASDYNTAYNVELFTTMETRLIEMPKDKMDAVHNASFPPNSYPTITIPAGTIKGITQDYHTWVSPYAHVISKKVPDGVVTRMLQAFWDHQAEAAGIYASIANVTASLFVGPFAIPYHPAAGAYFKAKGWAK